MIDLLEFALRGPWSFLGCFALAALIVSAAVLIVLAAANFRPLEGFLSFRHYAPTTETVNDHRRSDNRFQNTSHALGGGADANSGADAECSLDASDNESLITTQEITHPPGVIVDVGAREPEVSKIHWDPGRSQRHHYSAGPDAATKGPT